MRLFSFNLINTLNLKIKLEINLRNPPDCSCSKAIPDYTIIRDEASPGATSCFSREVDVELDDRLDEADKANLARLSEIIHAKDKRYERTKISYYIKGQRYPTGSWAYSFFVAPNACAADKSLAREIEIRGFDKSTYEQIKNKPLPRGEIIGAWMNSTERFVAFKKDQNMYIEQISVL